jgi:cell division protein FtsQ
MEMPYIKDAQLYSSLDGTLNVDIAQRRPVVRIITRYNHSYYLDTDGYIFPSRPGFTPHVLIANGYFTEGNELKEAKKLEDLAGNRKYKEWFEALKLALYINESSFWSSQLVQLYYNGDGDFEMIPRVGAHQIIFGDASNMEDKFQNLLTLYEEGLKYEGWNSYEKINLKYNNQVICTKR